MLLISGGDSSCSWVSVHALGLKRGLEQQAAVLEEVSMADTSSLTELWISIFCEVLTLVKNTNT